MEKTIFEQMGGTYTRKVTITYRISFYPPKKIIP